ncbi:MAG: hypothetical protein KBD78_15890 [Oligoflexales bacterium]|nr:hypothetical protein [Oligoflexales bacterium]
MKSSILGLIIIVVSACGNPGDEVEPTRNVSDLEKNPEKSGPAKTQNLSPCPNGTSLSYENFAAGFIAKNCLACHSQNLTNDFRAGAPDKINLDSYELFLPLINLVLPTLAGENAPSMPPNRLLNLTEQKLMIEWLRCGAPF